MTRIIFITHIFPYIFYFFLWRGTYHSKFQWGVRFLFITLFSLLLFLSPIRFMLHPLVALTVPLVFAASVVFSFLKTGKKPFFSRYDLKEFILCILIAIAVFIGLNVQLPSKQEEARGETVALSFPLKDGKYYVASSGYSKQLSGRITHGTPSERYAVDIIKSSSFTEYLRNFFKTGLSRYPIFGETLYAPCSGIIEDAVDGFGDLIPPERDGKHPAGNHAVISCKGASVLLAHMRKGSVRVRPGDTIQEGQVIGNVGNSGNTDIPHLHIHAVKQTSINVTRIEPLTIVFDGRILKSGDSIEQNQENVLGYAVTQYQLEDKTYTLFVADTQEKWMSGLMDKKKLDGADGMIFIFPDSRSRSFWNKNTYLDLDIYWINQHKVVGKVFLLSIKKTGSVVTISSPSSVDTVIELVRR
ncbi:hypothetical protein COT62_00055 [Candidatus Roizmanbacteria bacterium CG09_land_8_20_14_0_10_41_9]|uniref:M23ase beta-sheet core domain-containing protein n=1 Tax=Candidatus Roizmanbacteria bacterium CG09_land_8_20_14_0_10_41_9 TaxID=1974850 RepID=A0A2H0WW19_9BACT|nr:MAG: hypothetical protein COT62_00055 [Candidatus Roizmanbacteria bacterium CG09_land_8_20_14_0_10_41_9]